MSKGVKIWLIIAALLIVIGSIIFWGAMMAMQWNFMNLSTVRYQTNTHEITEAYKNFSILTDTADVIFLPSEDGKTAVTCYQWEKEPHTVSVQNGTLTVEFSDLRKWYDRIGFYFGTPKIKVYLPEGSYGTLSVKNDTGKVEIPGGFRFESMELSGSTGDVTNGASVAGDLRIKRSTGDITIENVSAQKLSLSVSTGKIVANAVTCTEGAEIKVSTGKADLTDVRCKTLSTTGDTGDLTLKDVVAAESISAERTTGDVKLEGCDAGELLIKTDTGDVKGSLLTEKVFIVRTDTGRIHVPKTAAGGRCDIETSTGDIRIDIRGES